MAHLDKRRGEPADPGAERRKVLLSIEADEVDRIDAAARGAGETRSDFMVRAALDRASGSHAYRLLESVDRLTAELGDIGQFRDQLASLTRENEQLRSQLASYTAAATTKITTMVELLRSLCDLGVRVHLSVSTHHSVFGAQNTILAKLREVADDFVVIVADGMGNIPIAVRIDAICGVRVAGKNEDTPSMLVA